MAHEVPAHILVPIPSRPAIAATANAPPPRTLCVQPAHATNPSHLPPHHVTPPVHPAQELPKWEKVGTLESGLGVYDMVSIGDRKQHVVFPSGADKLLETLVTQVRDCPGHGGGDGGPSSSS